MAGPTPAQVAAFNQNLVNSNAAGGYNFPVVPGSISADNPDGTWTTSSGSGSSGGAASAGPTIDQALLGQYDQSIGNTQAAVDRTGAQLQSGNSEIDASFQNAINQLLLNKNREQVTYDDNKKATANDYVGAKNTIGTNAGQSLSGILRLLGSKGAGGSSAARIAAPGAVTRQATLQRTDVGNTFGSNNKALDTNWNNFLVDNDNQVASAGSQRDQQKGALARQIDSSKATLLQSLAALLGQRAQAAGGNPVAAAAPTLAQANQALDSSSHYTVSPIDFKTGAFVAPTLGQYTVNPNAAPTYGGDAQSNDYTSPYLQALLGKKEQQTAVA